MAAPVRPAGVKAFGKEKWAFVPAIATQATPKVTEITAVGALDVSCYLYDTSAEPAVNQNRVTPPPRICDTVQYERMGLANMQGGDIFYAVDPQAATGSTGKKAFETLPEGTTGFLVRRLGISVNTDFAVGDFVTVFPVELGHQLVTKVGQAEATEVAVQQGFAITGPESTLVAVIAGP